MKKTGRLFLLSFLVYHVGLAQMWTWNSHAPGQGNKSICRDYIGNLYLRNPFDMGNWASSYSDTISKITASGQSIFSLVLPPNMRLTAMVCSPDSSFYLAGMFKSPISYGGTNIQNKRRDVWIARHESDGTLSWVKSFSSSEDQLPGGICMRGNNLIITGYLGDSAFYSGQPLNKPKNIDLFIAEIGPAGNLMNFKTATPGAPSGTMVSSSGASSCAIDPAGNLYILASFRGDVLLDNDTLNSWSSNGTDYGIFKLIKLNSSLQLQYIHELPNCFSCYSFYKELIVNSKGECFYLYDYSYGQSGNDVMWTKIHKVDAAGNDGGYFQLRSEKKSNIADMEIDNCDDIFFCGYWREYFYKMPSPFYTFAVGCLSSSLTLKTLWQDSTTSNRVYPKALAITAPNEIFVMGMFSDTTTMLNTLVTGNIETGFYGKYNFQFTNPCAFTTGVDETEAETQLVLYPNPASDFLYIRSDQQYSRYTIFTCSGKEIQQGYCNEKQIDTSRLPEGIYFVSLQTNNKVRKVAKVAIQH